MRLRPRPSFNAEARALVRGLQAAVEKNSAEDYLTGSQPLRGVAFLVRDGDRDREERRVPGREPLPRLLAGTRKTGLRAGDGGCPCGQLS